MPHLSTVTNPLAAAALIVAAMAVPRTRPEPAHPDIRATPASGERREDTSRGGLPFHVDTARIDSIFRPYTAPGSPGCAVAVTYDGAMVFGRGYGLAKIETGERLSTASVVEGASMAKQFVAYALLLLQADGKLSLDDPVRKYAPEVPDFGTPVTLRQMMHHTSGLRDLSEVSWLAGQGGFGLQLLPRQRALNFAPGTDYLYSNTNYDVLEKVVERVAGKPYPRFLDERIFGPLGMASTGMPGRAAARFVHAYTRREGGGFERDDGDPGFLTTPEDLVRWEANFYHARVGTPAMMAQMLADARLANGETAPYGLGLHTEPYRGVRRFWHGGLGAGFRSQFLHYPDQRRGVLVMCNLRQAEPVALAEAVSDVVLADVLPPAATAVEIARDTGVYANARTLGTAPISVMDGRMALLVWVTRYPLNPLGGNRFRVEGQPLTLEFRPSPAGTELVEHWDGRATPIVFRRLADRNPAPAELRAFTGAYTSRDLDATWRVRVKDGALHLAGAPEDVADLRAFGGDLFTDRDGYMLVAFHRDAGQQVDGFTVSTPRARGMAFRRLRR